MIDDARKVIFVHIPRTGGTSLEKYFGLPFSSAQVLTHKHLTAAELQAQDRERWKSYYTFTIVRHPLERLVSYAYYSSRGTGARFRPYIQAMLSEYPQYDDRSAQEALLFRLIFRPQWQSITDATGQHVLVDQVFRYEQFADVLTFLRQRYDLPMLDIRLNPGIARVARLDVRQQYDDSLLKQVSAFYHQDFAHLGYAI